MATCSKCGANIEDFKVCVVCDTREIMLDEDLLREVQKNEKQRKAEKEDTWR